MLTIDNLRTLMPTHRLTFDTTQHRKHLTIQPLSAEMNMLKM